MTPCDKSKRSYERLEFLGDRVLNLIVSEYLYDTYSDFSEGKLNDKLRFTSNDNLDEILDRIDGEFRSDVRTFRRSYELEDKEISSDDIEAFFGDYYLHHDLEELKKYFEKIFAKEIDIFDPDSDYISVLQVRTQKERKIVPEYQTVREESLPDNKHWFHLQVLIGEDVLGDGFGNRKSEAKKQAAFNALTKLRY